MDVRIELFGKLEGTRKLKCVTRPIETFTLLREIKPLIMTVFIWKKNTLFYQNQKC